MMKKIQVLSMAIMFSFPVFSGSAAGLNDFRFLDPIPVGATVTDLAVTPDNRYVLILSGPDHTLLFLDTWNFKMVSGSYDHVSLGSGNTVPQTITVSPDGKYAYVGDNKGRLSVIFLNPLNERLPEDNLDQGLTVETTIISSGEGINSVAVLPDINSLSSPDFYALMGYPSKNRLYWSKLVDGNSLLGGAKYWPAAGTYETFALGRGKKYGFVLTNQGSHNVLEDISCYSGNCSTLTAYSSLPPASDIGLLVADPVADLFAITYDSTSSQLLLFKPRVQNTIKLMDSFTVNDGAKDLALLNQAYGVGPLVFSAGGETVGISEVNRTDVLFSGSYREISQPDADLVSLTASGGTDGYVYAADSTSPSLIPISANPWVSSFSAVPGNTVADLSFTFQLSGTAPPQYRYRLYNDDTFGNWTKLLKESAVITVSDPTVTASTTVSMSKLHECKNVVTLLVDDGEGRRGRSAVIINKDENPPPPGFNLSFGDKKLKVNFSAQNLCDLSRYEVFYGDSAAVPETYAAVSAAYTRAQEVNSPTAGEKYETEITGLTNGRRYYVQLAVWDKTDHVTLSRRKSAVPERPVSLTEFVGEEGGINCAVHSGGRGGPRSMAWMVLPFLLVLGYRAHRWRRR